MSAVIEQAVADLVADGRYSEAVGMLAETHFSTLFSKARWKLRDNDAAEVAVQETFLAALESLSEGATARNYATWLSGILYNRCRRARTAKARASSRAADVEPSELAAPSPPNDARLFTCVVECIAQLDDSARYILLHHAVDGAGFAELARTLGVSRQAARKRWNSTCRRILKQLASAPPANNDT